MGVEGGGRNEFSEGKRIVRRRNGMGTLRVVPFSGGAPSESTLPFFFPLHDATGSADRRGLYRASLQIPRESDIAYYAAGSLWEVAIITLRRGQIMMRRSQGPYFYEEEDKGQD